MSKEVELQNLWDRFVREHGPKSGAFLQSWEWGEFQEAVGRKVLRFIIDSNGPRRVDQNIDGGMHEINSALQIIKVSLPFGKSYLYIPRGPILNNQEAEINNQKFLEVLKNLGTNENAIFIKIDPALASAQIDNKILNSKYNILVSKNLQPKDTLILDLSKPEEEMIANMHEKTRYNIRLAEKKGVQIRWSTPETIQADLEKFWQLAGQTSSRDKFNYHPKKYYATMLCETLSAQPETKDRKNLSIRMLIAEKDDKVLGANIIVFFGETVTYLHGASNYAHRELMAPHLLQWESIRKAKLLGFKYYDFWGIAPELNKRPITKDLKQADQDKQYRPHPWAGITRFKLGFGGETVSYAPAFDLPVNNLWYNLYKLTKKFS